MKRLFFILSLALFLPFLLSCTRDTTYTLAGSYEGKILVAQDKELMERMIECAITGKCEHLSVMELLPNRRVFLVDAGTEVAMRGGPFSFSNARKVHILEGERSGQDGWVYDRMLCEDRSSVPSQLAFARLYLTDTN
jgi:hypothetical protein